jgi:hypothetical protein
MPANNTRIKSSANTYAPGPAAGTVRAPDGRILTVPAGWSLLPPGDAGLTGRVKKACEHWVVQEKKGRKLFSRGVYAPAATIERIRTDLAAERSTESYAKRRASDFRRREAAQTAYVEDFCGAIVAFLAFTPEHAGVGGRLARAVADHATPVGSGTVARTERIPIEARAEAAVIAWMRHQTTAYDSMRIPREKGKRREVRRMLARRSQELLDRYRHGRANAETCPLVEALDRISALPPAESQAARADRPAAAVAPTRDRARTVVRKHV